MKQFSHRKYQQGFVLVMVLLFLALLISGVLLAITEPERKRITLEARTAESLQKAKDALIAYAVTYYESYVGTNPNAGEFAVLPCPDMGSINGEGAQDTNCGGTNVNVVGRLPWRTLNISSVVDAHGECLWYAVSGPYKSAPEALLNEDSPGLLQLFAEDGLTPITANTHEDRIVAAVIAPGPPIAGQSRNNDPSAPVCGGNYTAANYLEVVGNANNNNLGNVLYGVSRIATARTPSSFINDRVLTITREDIWGAIRRRNVRNLDPAAPDPVSPYPGDIFRMLLENIGLCIVQMANNNNGRVPWPAPVSMNEKPGGPSPQLYTDNNNWDDVAGVYSGRVPFRINDSYVGDTTLSTSCANFSANTLYGNLWDNWKDHIFYVISEARAPDSGANNCTINPASCVEIGGIEYTAILFFAGQPLPVLGQQRKTAPDMPVVPVIADDKSVIDNYIDGVNLASFLNNDGDDEYEYPLESAQFNDIMVCIADDFDDPVNPNPNPIAECPRTP